MRTRVRALAVHALARARGGRPRRRLLLSRPLGGSAAKWTNVVWPIKSRPTNQQTNTHYSFIGIDWPTMPNPVRLLSPASIGQQKSRHENSLLLFPRSLPMSRPRASSHQAQPSWSAELPVPCTHFFYALNMIMAGYVGIPCSYQQTLQNKGDHPQMQQLAHNNKTF